MRHFLRDTQGFSLIQISLLVAIAAIVFVSTLPGGKLGSDAEKRMLTLQRMQQIEEATRAYMANNLRRPCPADAEQPPSSTTFGLEAATPGTCTGGSPAANFTSNSGVVAGSVPTKTLGLPDETGVDGYGRRIMYQVDKNATAQVSCRDMQNLGTKGAVKILEQAGWVTSTDVVAYPNVYTTWSLPQVATKSYNMWALWSMGRDGMGAYPAEGGTNRLLPASIDNHDTMMNGILEYSGSYTVLSTDTFTGSLVQREPYTSNGSELTNFDDLVWYLDADKNTCCLGKMCNSGFTLNIDAISNTIGTNLMLPVATGDINGDGISDMVFTTESWNVKQGMYVLFGTKTGWPLPTTGTDLTTYVNGTKGFAITGGNFGYAVPGNEAGRGGVTVGDINGDGYDDIVFTGGNVFIVYGKSSFAAAVNVGSLSAATSGFSFTFPAYFAPSRVSVGDVNNDGYKDIIMGIRTDASTWNGYVIYGRSIANWITATSGSPSRMNLTALASADGFRITTSNAATYGIEGYAANSADVNGDGYDDIVFTGGNSDAYILWGRSTANWNTDISGSPATLDFAGQCASATKCIRFTGGGALPIWEVHVADMNNDQYMDVVGSNGGSGVGTGWPTIYVYYGKAAGSWATPLAINTNGFTIDYYTRHPAWAGAYSSWAPFVNMADINGDGKTDVLVGQADSSPGGVSGAGSVWVMLQPATGWADTVFFDNLDGTHAFSIDGLGKSGLYVNTADINRDGKTDIFVGSQYGGTTSSARPTTQILLGRKAVPWSTSESLSQVHQY